VDQDSQGLPHVAGELLVTYNSDAPTGRRDSAVDELNAETEETFPNIDTRLVSFPQINTEASQAERGEELEGAIQALEQTPQVESADYNYIAEASYVPNDPARGAQYSLGKVRAYQAWEYSRGRGTDIAILDSGIANGQPDIGKISAERDFIQEDDNAQPGTNHGTHVAGTAAALTGNDTGVAGACPSCRIMDGKVLGSDGRGPVSDVIDGIMWSANNGAEVINLSLGHQRAIDAERDAVNYARNNGAVVVGAAGNGGDNVAIYPGAYRNAISVAATDSNDRRASFSNYGSWVDLSAPGTRIASTVPGGYGYKSGTSMATPHVSALAGLISAQGYSAAQVRNRMQATAKDLGPRGRDVGYGYGRVDFYRAARRSYTQIVDNASARFSASNLWSTSSWNNEKAGPNYQVTKPASRSGTAKFRLDVPSTTRYAVYARWPDHPTFNSRTRYLIRTTSGFKVKAVDQRKRGGRFNYLGTYRLPAGDKNYIQVGGRSAVSGYIIADAVLIRRR
jgi:thermitase